jgi:hypothetical protein
LQAEAERGILFNGEYPFCFGVQPESSIEVQAPRGWIQGEFQIPHKHKRPSVVLRLILSDAG